MTRYIIIVGLTIYSIGATAIGCDLWIRYDRCLRDKDVLNRKAKNGQS